MKYTKGKWDWEKSLFPTFRDEIQIASDSKDEIQWIALCHSEANAKLISKAPEMYEALKLYISDLRNVSPGGNSRIDQMESLLKEIEK